MSEERRAFKKLLAKLPGLRIDVESLFLSNNDRILVVSRIMNMHPSKGPDACLDRDTLHDRLLELMENCHICRDQMWMRSRMEPRLWYTVRANTSWAVGLNLEVLRTLALGLTQAAWAHFKNPVRNRNGVSKPYCKLAVAALRFSNDIDIYEGHLKDPRDLRDVDFSEWRGPIYLDNGKRLIGPDGKPCTQPVFPICRYNLAINPRSTLSKYYFDTEDDPEIFKTLERV